MQAFHPGTGMMLEFPDNTPDEDIQQHFQNAQASMPINAPSVAQQFLDGARGAYEQQQLAPPPVNGRGMVGLDPQQAQFMLQQRQNQAAMQQQSASEQARNRIEQQKMTQQGIESEKDRGQRLKLHQENLKNIIQERRIQADRDKFLDKVRAEEGNLDRGLEERIATLNATLEREGMTQRKEQFGQEIGLRQQNLGIDQQRLELQKKQMEDEGWRVTTVMRENPDTGEREPWEAYTKPHFQPEFISPSQVTGKQLDIVDRPDHPKVFEAAQSMFKELAEENKNLTSDAKRSLPEIQNEALVYSRLQYNQPPFVTQREMDTFIEGERKSQIGFMKTEKKTATGKSDLTPEEIAQAELDAKTNALDLAGIEYTIVNGRIKFPDKPVAPAPSQTAAPTAGYTPPQNVNWSTITQNAGNP